MERLEAAFGIGRYEWRPAQDRLVWSPGLLLIYGLQEAPQGEDAFSSLLHPDDRVRVEAETTGFLGSDAPGYAHSFRIVRGGGAVRSILDRGVIERDALGRVQIIRGINIDVTDALRAPPDNNQKRIAARLAELETLYAEAPLGLAFLDTDLRFVRINDALSAINGYSAPEHLGHRAWDLLPSLRSTAEPPLRRVLDSGVALRNVSVRGETRADPGRRREWCEQFYPVRGDDGSTIGVAVICEEVTARVEAERALRLAHDTYRQLVDHSPFGILIVDADFRLFQVSDGAQKSFQHLGRLIGSDFAEAVRTLWSEAFAAEVVARFRHTLSTGDSYHSPSSVEQRADLGIIECYDWQVERISLADGRSGVVCHLYDLSVREAQEQKIKFLMREVSHRANNMLTLVDTIARQTAPAGGKDFLARFSARMRSLAAGQALLVQTDWEGADLTALIESHLQHFRELLGKRIVIDGPPICVSPQAAQALGMAVHELATNAAKYGALANDTGRVEISWRIIQGPVVQFAMSWTEKDGPRVAVPKRSGFGSLVINTMVQAALSAEVALDFHSDGVAWSLRCPLTSLELIRGSASRVG